MEMTKTKECLCAFVGLSAYELGQKDICLDMIKVRRTKDQMGTRSQSRRQSEREKKFRSRPGMENLWEERDLKGEGGSWRRLSCELLVVYWWQNCPPEFDRWRQYCAEELGGRGAELHPGILRGGSKRVSQN